MSVMLTIKEAAKAINMSQYAIRKGITSGLYPAIRVCGNPKGKILINIDEFISTLNVIADRNIKNSEQQTNGIPAIRRIAE